MIRAYRSPCCRGRVRIGTSFKPGPRHHCLSRKEALHLKAEIANALRPPPGKITCYVVDCTCARRRRAPRKIYGDGIMSQLKNILESDI